MIGWQPVGVTRCRRNWLRSGMRFRRRRRLPPPAVLAAAVLASTPERRANKLPGVRSYRRFSDTGLKNGHRAGGIKEHDESPEACAQVRALHHHLCTEMRPYLQTHGLF